MGKVIAMDKAEILSIDSTMKSNHRTYLNEISEMEYAPDITARLDKLRRLFRKQLRTAEGNAKSFILISSLAQLIFGLDEDLKRPGLPLLSFDKEISAINRFIISALDVRKTSKYGGKCNYGETLLNCYLDIFITLTVLKTPRKFEAKPSFLVNPATGSILEIDIMLEDFRLGFELQGDHHYQDHKVRAKDVFKISAFASSNRILIPVNIAQLQGNVLQSLIVNSMKDYLQLHELLDMKDATRFKPGSASPSQLLKFSKAVQRIYLARVIFGPALNWLDNEANIYISSQSRSSPISSHSNAPRQSLPAGDLDIDYVYQNLKYVTQARKKLYTTINSFNI